MLTLLRATPETVAGEVTKVEDLRPATDLAL